MSLFAVNTLQCHLAVIIIKARSPLSVCLYLLLLTQTACHCFNEMSPKRIPKSDYYNCEYNVVKSKNWILQSHFSLHYTHSLELGCKQMTCKIELGKPRLQSGNLVDVQQMQLVWVLILLQHKQRKSLLCDCYYCCTCWFHLECWHF